MASDATTATGNAPSLLVECLACDIRRSFGAAEPVLLSGARQTQIWSICAAVTRTLVHDADERTPTQAD